MRILSVIPATNSLSTTIHAVKDGKFIDYVYSPVYELLRDPNNPQEWCQWNGGDLTQAIAWVISLPGSINDNFDIAKQFVNQ